MDQSVFIALLAIFVLGVGSILTNIGHMKNIKRLHDRLTKLERERGIS